MDRFDDHIGRGGQKAVNKVRSGDRPRFGTAITFELGVRRNRRGPVVVQGKPHDVFLAGRRVGLRRIFGEAVGRDQTAVLRLQPVAPVGMCCCEYW